MKKSHSFQSILNSSIPLLNIAISMPGHDYQSVNIFYQNNAGKNIPLFCHLSDEIVLHQHDRLFSYMIIFI